MKKIPFVTLEQAAEIKKTYPTPFHLYDEKGIRANARAVKEAFAWNKGFREYFAVKATPNPYIMDIFRDYDFGFDCSSKTELLLADAVGASGEHIMFSSNETPAEEFEYARKLDAIINLDDITHIDFLAAHGGLQELSGYYGLVRDFAALDEEAFLGLLTEGCWRIGRSLNDTRGLFHSFRDARETMLRLFADLREMLGDRCLDWEIVFEFRLKRGRHVRIYADVLVITEDKVFSLEFKMKDAIDPEEIRQAAKYVPYLEIVFGPEYEIIPVLVLTAARELFRFEPIGRRDLVLPVASGDMLFNVFDEYLGFLET